MASKRSQVQSNLPVIETNQPVARVIDTFAPAAAPAKTPNRTANILETLINFGQSQNDRILAKRKAEQEALEKRERDALNLAFLENPDQFAQDLRLGKFKNLTSPAQLLAGEHMGVRLARKYNVFLREEYAKAGLAESDDASAFFEFENGMRTQFIQDNGDAFTKEGVSAGFSKNFRQYIQSLDSTHTSTANTNLKANQETAFKDVIYTNIDGFLAGRVSNEDFGNNIRIGQSDAKLGYNFDNNKANTLTVDALISYARDTPDISFAQARGILNLANFIQTSPGSTLSGTKEASFKIGQANAAIDDEEERENDKKTKAYKTQKLMVTDTITSKIQAALKADPTVSLETILTPDELKKAQEFYPKYLQDFDTYQDFFQNQSAERLEGSAVINLRQQILASPTRDKARLLLDSMVSNGKLKGDASVFGTLVQDIQKIPTEETTKPRPQFTRDALYQSSYRLLGGQITVDGNYMAGSVPPTPDKTAKLEYFNFAFLDLYLGVTLINGKAYADMSRIEQANAVRDLYNQAKDFTPNE